MEVNIEEKIKQSLADIKKFFDDETAKLTAKKEEVMQATQNKLMIEQQQKELDRIKLDLERREKELQTNITLNRERTTLLDAKEKRLDSEKARIQSLVENI